MDEDGFVAGVIVASLIWIVLVWWTRGTTDDSWRHQIEKHGAAHFYLDDNKDRQWDWTQ